MKMTSSKDINNVASWIEARPYLAQTLSEMIAVINGNVGLTDNCQTSLVTVSVTAADTDTVVEHKLGKTPQGYLIAGNSANVTVYDGATANTDSKLYVRASGATMLKLLVF